MNNLVKKKHLDQIDFHKVMSIKKKRDPALFDKNGIQTEVPMEGGKNSSIQTLWIVLV